MDQCFDTVENIAVQNTNNDAWLGAITVTVNGVDHGLTCGLDDGCGGRSSNNKFIVVDGNSDTTGQAPTHCQNGASCTLRVSGEKGNFL